MLDETALVLPPHIPADRVLDFDLYRDPRVLANPLDFFAGLLKTAPEFFWTPRNGGHWVVMGHDAVDEAFHNYELFGSMQHGIPDPPNPPEQRMFLPIQMNPPEHGIYRSLLNPMFGPKAIWPLENSIRELCVELIEKVRSKGECEICEAVALPLPVLVFIRQMGLPEDRYEELAEWANQFMDGETLEIRQQAMGSFVQLLDDLLKEREARPRNDWMSKLLELKLDGKPLDRKTIVLPISNVLFVGGLDTVKNSLGHFLRILAGRPDLQKQLRDDPKLAPEAIEELFRVVGGTNPPRKIRRDGEFRGVSVREGEMAMICTATSGIDERFVKDPFEIDFSRKQKVHVSFGVGPHRCLGSNLARLDLKVFMEEWFSRIPEFKIKPGTAPTYACGPVNAIHDLHLVW